jgi:hypothetical protein
VSMTDHFVTSPKRWDVVRLARTTVVMLHEPVTSCDSSIIQSSHHTRNTSRDGKQGTTVAGKQPRSESH